MLGVIIGCISGLLMAPQASGAADPWDAYTQAQMRISSRLATRLAESDSEDSLAVWVFFTDKGITNDIAYRGAVAAYEKTLTERARQRRRLRRDGDLIDIYDLPIVDDYIRQTLDIGARLRSRSRWLNAISLVASPHVIRRIAALPMVRGVTPVAVFRRRPLPQTAGDTPSKTLTGANHLLNYGVSLTQLDQIQAPALHDLGLSGRGVRIAMLDTGYNLNHVAFDSIRTRVIAERDFINNDGITANEAGQDRSDQHNHGSETLSAVGGYAPGNLIGPAYGAQFLLAKTESVSFERRIEEDWWMEAIEWADSLGADIVSSSLGYNIFTEENFQYRLSDLDGQTAVTTRAAAIAVGRGIVVVNAMGNEGQSLWQKMIVPADAAEVISVGAVNAGGLRASFSSLGPTADGRIKPDVMAMGASVQVVNPATSNGYLRLNGTSFAAPLVAGVGALLLEAFPNWTPARVLQALQSTASQASTPDTALGYGIVDAKRALLTESASEITQFTASNDSAGVLLSWTTRSEINVQGWRMVRQAVSGQDTTRQNLTQDLIAAYGAGFSTGRRTYFFLDATVVSGVTYDYTLEGVGINGSTAFALPLASSITFIPTGVSNLPQFSLRQNYPNPFNPTTQIAFDLRISIDVTLVIYNILGQRVRTLVSEPRDLGGYVETWDGRDDDGRLLASGIYFYRLTAGSFVSTKKMMLIR